MMGSVRVYWLGVLVLFDAFMAFGRSWDTQLLKDVILSSSSSMQYYI